MNNSNSLSHTKWKYKYHIVFGWEEKFKENLDKYIAVLHNKYQYRSTKTKQGVIRKVCNLKAAKQMQ